MALSTKANGSRIRLMEEASSGTLMAMFTKGNGTKIKLMGMEFMSTLMVPDMRVSGEMIFRMASAKKAGKTAQAMLVDTWKV
jgi:hypothetical protein